jgi:hypothetical protein
MAEDLTQLNVHVPDEIIKLIDGDEELDEPGLRARYGWSKRDLVMTALRALKAIMDAHGKYAEQHPPDVADLYMRIAREIPAGYIDVPRDGVRAGYRGDQPAVELVDWIVTELEGDLFAQELGGEGRLAKISDGELKPIRLPAAGLN